MNREEADNFRFMMRDFRHEFGLSRTDLTIAMKVGKSTVKHIESGAIIPFERVVVRFFAVKERFERAREEEEMGLEGLS